MKPDCPERQSTAVLQTVTRFSATGIRTRLYEIFIDNTQRYIT